MIFLLPIKQYFIPVVLFSENYFCRLLTSDFCTFDFCTFVLDSTVSPLYNPSKCGSNIKKSC